MKTLLLRASIAVVVLAGAVAAVMLVRSAMVRTEPLPQVQAYPFQFDEPGAPERMAGALRFPTVFRPVAPVMPSTEEGALDRALAASTDAAPTSGSTGAWLSLHEYLARSFPRVHRTLDREVVHGLSLLYHWQGTDPDLDPILLTAHMDVVAGSDPSGRAETADWSYPPFSGAIEGGYVWGRGAIDSKGPLMAIMEAVEGLLASGFVPRRSVLLAFGHDGESDGEGVNRIVELLSRERTRPVWVLGEGSYLLSGLMPGIRDPIAMVGVAPKTGLDLRLIARAEAGSRSIPPRDTAFGALSEAIARVEDEAFPVEIRGPADELLLTLRGRMDPGTRLLVANLWLLRAPLGRALTESPILNSNLRSTAVTTRIQPPGFDEQLPAEAAAHFHVRLAPWDTPESVLERVRSAVAELPIEVAAVPSDEAWTPPPAASRTDSEGFRVIREAVHASFPDVVGVVPGLAPRDTDTWQFGALSDAVYGFAPFRVDESSLPMLHGVNERVRISVYLGAVRFYADLIRRGAE